MTLDEIKDFQAPSIRELIDRGAKKFGDATFIKFFRDGKIEERSFKRVREDSLAFCRWIRSRSTDKLHVAIVSKSNYEYITCVTGVLAGGCVAVPFSPEMTAAEASRLFENADIDMVLYEPEFEERAEEVKANCPFIRFFINLGDTETFEKIYSEYSSESEYAPLSEVEINKDDCAVIIYTSGTTGVRKGVMLSSNALIGNIMYHDYCTDVFTENGVSLSVLPMYHCFCFSGDYIKNLKDGVQVALNGNLRELGANLLRFEPKVVRVVPMIAQTLLQRVKFVMSRNPDLTPNEAAKAVFGKNIQWLISGGAYLNPQLVIEYEKLGIHLRQGYGMTEAGCRISVPDIGVSYESVGRVIDVCTARIRNGEIQIKSPTLMMGYYNMPEETAKMFTEDGWLKTGDIGELTENNELFITGRVKNLIILSSGENVSPEAIEKKFADHELIDEIMVYAENDKIVAEIYPDYVSAEFEKIGNVREFFETLVDDMNATAKASHVISVVKIRTEPFEKTGSGKIKRKETVIG